MNQCIRLTNSMKTFSNKNSYEELKQATIGIVSVLGNIRSVNKFNNKN